VFIPMTVPYRRRCCAGATDEEGFYDYRMVAC
jgi:hypothetical protein